MCSILDNAKYAERAKEISFNVAAAILPLKSIELATDDEDQFATLMQAREEIIEKLFQTLKHMHTLAHEDVLDPEDIEIFGKSIEEEAYIFHKRIVKLQELMETDEECKEDESQ